MIWILYFFSALFSHYLFGMQRVLWNISKFGYNYEVLCEYLMPRWVSFANILNMLFKCILLSYIAFGEKKIGLAIGVFIGDYLISMMLPFSIFSPENYRDIFYSKVREIRLLDKEFSEMLMSGLDLIYRKRY